MLAGKSSAGRVRAGSDDDVEILFSADATPITEGDEEVRGEAFVPRSTVEPTAATWGLICRRVVEQFVERLQARRGQEKTSRATIVVDFCEEASPASWRAGVFSGLE